MKRLYKQGKLYIGPTFNLLVKTIYYKGKKVVLSYYKGRMIYNPFVNPWDLYVKEGLIYQLDCENNGEYPSSFDESFDESFM